MGKLDALAVVERGNARMLLEQPGQVARAHAGAQIEEPLADSVRTALAARTALTAPDDTARDDGSAGGS